MFLSINIQRIDNIDTIIDIAEESVIFLHHDAITGTAKRLVDADYLTRIKVLQKRVVSIFEDYLGINLSEQESLMNQL